MIFNSHVYFFLFVSFLSSISKSFGSYIEFQNDYDGRVDICITDENSDDNMIRFPMFSGETHRVEVDKVFHQSSKNVSIVAKGPIPTLTAANKCSLAQTDKNFRVVTSKGPLKTVACSISQIVDEKPSITPKNQGVN